MKHNAQDHVLLDRRRDAARRLGVSETQVLKFESKGLLKRVKLPGLRAVRYATRDVEALAEQWIRDSRQESA